MLTPHYLPGCCARKVALVCNTLPPIGAAVTDRCAPPPIVHTELRKHFHLLHGRGDLSALQSRLPLKHHLPRLRRNFHGVQPEPLGRLVPPTVNGIFPAASLVNHSCEPNSCFHSRRAGTGGQPLEYVLRCTTDIAAGEEVCVSYLAHFPNATTTEVGRELGPVLWRAPRFENPAVLNRRERHLSSPTVCAPRRSPPFFKACTVEDCLARQLVAIITHVNVNSSAVKCTRIVCFCPAIRCATTSAPTGNACVLLQEPAVPPPPLAVVHEIYRAAVVVGVGDRRDAESCWRACGVSRVIVRVVRVTPLRALRREIGE